MSIWEQNGDFNQITGSGLLRHREVTFKNTHTDSVIKKIKMSGYNSGILSVLETNSDISFQRLKQVLLQAGFSVSTMARSLKISIRTNYNLGFLKRLIDIINDVEPQLGEIKQNIYHLLDIDPSLNYEVAAWLQYEDFNQTFDTSDRSSMNRRVTFESTVANSLITKFEILGCRNGDFSLKATIKKEYLPQIKQVYSQENFPELDFYQTLPNSDTIKLLTSNLGWLNKFLTLINNFEPHFLEIKQNINNLLGIDSNMNYEFPVWVKSGNFGYIHHDGFREEVFKSTAPDSLINKIKFTKYRANSIEISLTTKTTENYNQLEQALIQAGCLVQNFAVGRLVKTIILNDNNLNVANLINVIDSFEPQFAEIKQGICNALGVNVNQNNAAMLISEDEDDELPQAIIDESFALANTLPVNINVPGPGSNETKIAALNALSRELPDKFKCTITDQVMTTPVYDPIASKMRFDEPQISFWLKTNPINPFTRTPLTSEQLILDVKLQQKIEAFIQEEEKIQQNKTLSSPKTKPIIHRYKRIRESEVDLLNEEAEIFLNSNPLPNKRRKLKKRS